MNGTIDRPLRMCLAAQSYHPVFAGAGLRFQRYLAGLKTRGVTPLVFCGTATAVQAQMMGLDPPWEHVPEGTILPTEFVDDVPVHRVRLPDHNSARRAFRFARALQRFSASEEAKLDVIQLLALRFSSIPALLQIRARGLPTVFSGTMVSELPTNPLRRLLFRHHVGLPLRLVDRVVASSEVMRQYFLNLGVTAPIEVIPNGVDLARYRPATTVSERQHFRDALGVPQDATLLLHVGSVTPRKGTDLLLEMWARVARRYPGAHLVIAGPRQDRADPGHREFNARIEALRQASGGADRVHFTGFVERIADLLRAADVFIFPSRREGLGNAVLEAMATAVPVVLAPFVGLAQELGVTGREYVMADHSAESLAVAVGRLLDEPERAAQIGASGRAWVHENMSLDRTLDAYAALYHSLKSTGSGR